MAVRKVVLSGLFVIGVSACVSPGTDFDGLPFYRRDRIRVGRDKQGKARDTRETKSPIVLGRSVASEDGDKVFLTLPFPMLTYSRTGDDSQLLFMSGVPAVPATAPPLRAATGAANRFRSLVFGGYALDHEDDQGDRDKDTALWPLFAYGHSEDEGGYFAVFPFGGTTKGILGKDDALWLGFPLPFYLWMKDGDFESRHLMWPFINWVEGDGRSGFRVWPFYGHYERHDDEGRKAYDRSWLLWPFVTWQSNGSNLTKFDEQGKEVPQDPTDVFAIIPFYGHVHGPEKRETNVLYPFFRYTSFTRDEGWELRAPFPFLIVGGNNKGHSRNDFWPFFGIRKRPGYVRHFVLAPFERYELRDDDWVYDKNFSLFPFFQYHYHLDRKKEEDYTRWQLWPFIHHRHEADGSRDTWAMSIFPMRNENLEEIFLPFVTMYRHRDIPAIGSKETQVLFGLASWRTVRSPDRDNYDRVSLLFGLFQYRQKGTEKALRFFYFNDWPVWEAEG